MRFPKTLLEFQAQFPDEESCWDYLRRVRWPRGFVCPRCRARYSHFIETRRLEQCAECRYQASVTAGTVLHGTRVSLRVWFLGAFFLGRHKKGISALQFQRDTGLGNYQTAWSLLHKLRSGLARNPAARLTGAVEADETYLGGYHPGRGRGLGKTGVAVAVERRAGGAGKARLGVVRRATSEELCAFVRGAIDARHTEIFTDGWPAYRQLGREGIPHHPEVAGRGPAAARKLAWAHTIFGNLKGWIHGTFHGISGKYAQRKKAGLGPYDLREPQGLDPRNLPRNQRQVRPALPR
jgi:hypothetical protein